MVVWVGVKHNLKLWKRDHNLFDEMAHSLGFSASPLHRFKTVSVQSKKPANSSNLSIRSCALPREDAYKLVAEVKEKLNVEHSALPVGKNGRDDEEMILWFLEDRNYSVKDAVSKLTKAIRWRHEFGVSELSEDSIKRAAETGKAYVHDYLDVYDRPVLIANLSKHIPGDQELYEDEKLYTFMIEKALAKLPLGKQEILAIIDFRGFEKKNVDVKLIPFLFDTLYYYYPQRLSEVLFVDTPFIYMPMWQMLKPFLKSYADLVKFCPSKTVAEEYFTSDTVPTDFLRLKN